MSALKDIISKKRESLGLTQEAFARSIGVTPLSVCRWETGTAQPRRKMLQKMDIDYSSVNSETKCFIKIVVHLITSLQKRRVLPRPVILLFLYLFLRSPLLLYF